MLSILIPIYNIDVTKLVAELTAQCQKQNIPFEIICLDDGSVDSIKSSNRKINGMIGVNYVELSENMGRSRIRNQLARLARFDYLLFLDADSQVVSKKFIKLYLKSIDQYPGFIMNGGRIYQKLPPKDLQKILHYRYGVNREAISSKRRNRQKVASFHSNNFIIPRKIQLKVPFDQDLESYGYEDIYLAHCLTDASYSIVHIDNPVLHNQLRDAKDFLVNARSAVHNLAYLHRHKGLRSSKLLRTYEVLNMLNLKGSVLTVIKPFVPRIHRLLETGSPKLVLLDLLRLYWLLTEIAQKSAYSKL